MNGGAARMLQDLAAALPAGSASLVVALSGGGDSSALLAALTELAGLRRAQNPVGPLWRLRAVHVDHGLQPAAAAFRGRCEQLCARLGIALTIRSAAVAAAAGVSLEAAARDVRYTAFADELGADECLLTAHHAEDQAETLLLQALRGAGLKGLSAMPVRRRLGAGWQLRPLLAVPRGELEAYARDRGIVGVSDPMNDDPRYDRVYLRRSVWPALASRWPAAGIALSRTAAHLAEAQDLLDALALEDLSALRDGEALSIPKLRMLSPARQANALRRWLANAGVLPPSTARLSEALRQILDADADHQPRVAWGLHALRRYRNRVFLTATDPPRLAAEQHWSIGAGAPLDLGAGLGHLVCTPRRGGLARLPPVLHVRARSGGESLRPGPRAATQSVQHLCQSLGILPWLRDALPFVHAGEHLVAVGDLWIDARWCAPEDGAGLGFEWRGGPLLV
jgi:tRNA(Ile)-lysidine synthase